MASSRLNIAVGADGLTVIAPGDSSPRFYPGSLDAWKDAQTILSELFDGVEDDFAEESARTRPGDGTAVYLAILPPLCEVRLLDLPGLRDDEIERVLRRDASRYFLTGGRSVTVGGARIELRSAARNDAAPVLAAAVPSAFLDALEAAASARGWEIKRIVPAHASWLDALENAGPRGRRGKKEGVARLAIANLDMAVHIVTMTDDGMVHLRRFPGIDEDAIRALGPDSTGFALLLTPAEVRPDLSELLRTAGWTVPDGAEGSDAREEAARGADEVLPEIVPPFIARKRTTRERGFTSRVLVAAVFLLVLAAGVYYWGAARAYDSVRAERAAIRAEVEPALIARDSLDHLLTRLDEVSALGSTSGWTAFLVELSVLLPPETHLQSLRAVGDTVVIEAVGGRAGEALEALRATPLLHDVLLEGPIMRELEDGATARERFSVSAVRVSDGSRGQSTAMESIPNPAGGAP